MEATPIERTADVRFGSFTSILAYSRHVRSSPNSDRLVDAPRWSRSAIRRHQTTLFDHLVGGDLQLCGTARPSDLAVFRLMTSRNLVGCITGRSAGFAPLRTFPA